MSAQNDLENVLESLAGIESVIGGLVASREGDLLAAFMPEIYENDALEGFCAKLSDMSAALSGLGIEQQESVLNFEGIKLVIKAQKYGFLLIMCQSNVSIPLLNLSTNIVCKKVGNVLEVEFGDGTNVSEEMSRTMSLKRSSLKPAVQKPDYKAVSKALLVQIESTLANFIGPAAKIVIKKSIKKAGGEDQVLYSHQMTEFLGLLELRISDSSKRSQFRSQINEFSLK